MTSPLPIPLSEVNQAGVTQRTDRNEQLRQAYSAALAQYARYQKAIEQATHAVGAKRANEVYGNAYAQAKANVGQARATYEKYSSGQLVPYKNEYTHLTELGAANPNLETLLGKITPYDPQSAVDRMNAATQRTNALSQLTQARQQLNEDYATQARTAGITQEDSLRGLLGNFAGRGMAFSSGYGNAVGEQNRNYADYLGALASNKQRGLAAADINQAGVESNYQNMIGQALVGATGRMANQAGKLGLGSTDLPYYTELARRKLAGT